MASHDEETLSIPLSALREGVSVFTLQTTSPELCVQEQVVFHEIIEVRVSITAMGEDYLFTVDVNGEGTFICDRCGVQFQRDVNGSVRTLYTFDPLKVEDDVTGDVRWIAPESSFIDLTQDIKDALLLAVPRKCLCKASCAGLCPRCGADLNKNPCSCQEDEIDPRWEGLKKLKE